MANAKARISLTGTDPAKVDAVCAQIRLISERTGVSMAGPRRVRRPRRRKR